MITNGGNYILEEFAAVRRQVATFKLCLLKETMKGIGFMFRSFICNSFILLFLSRYNMLRYVP